MKKRYKEVLIALIAILMAFSLIFDYAGNYYSDVEESSANWLIFTTTFYTASHLFCEENYTCAFSNLTFPEFQQQELQKYQDQMDWTSQKAYKWKNVSNQLIWISLLLNLILFYVIWKNKNA